jgi:hypothetical protein
MDARRLFNYMNINSNLLHVFTKYLTLPNSCTVPFLTSSNFFSMIFDPLFLGLFVCYSIIVIDVIKMNVALYRAE